MAVLLAAFAGAALLGPTGVAAQRTSTPERFREVAETIRRTLAEEGVPSMAVAVARGGEVLWEEGFGWADREGRVAATPHTLYSLASISKPITATGLMVLVERGEVELDRPANAYLGRGKITGHAGDASGATVRRVLAHTAGLPLHYQFFYDGDAYRPTTMDEAIARYGITVNAPGEVYQYSNLGYGILDHIIARVSGKSYEDFMRSEVFLPLGMTHSSIHVGPGLEAHAAVRYDEDGRPIPFYDFDHRGASAVYSSAHDLVRFGAFHLGHELPGQRAILSDSTRRAMQVVATPPDDDDDGGGYGLGWGIGDDHGLRRVAHSGGMPGVRTFLALYPEEELAVAALTNTGSNAVFRITEDIVATLVPRYAEALERDRAKEGEEDEEEPAAFEPPAELVGEWNGRLVTWEDSLAFHLEVQPDGDVHVRIADGLETLLNPLEYAGYERLWSEEDRRLVGRFAGRIPTPDAGREPHSVLLDLRLRDDGTLSGQASAQDTEPPIFGALSSWVELEKGPAPDEEE